MEEVTLKFRQPQKHYNDDSTYGEPTMSLKTLKRQQYHWFWGLRTRAQTLWEATETWVKTPTLVASVREQQTLLAHKFWGKRFFYWLFNINDYNTNHYKLAIYDQINAPSEADKAPLKQLYYHWFWGLRDGGKTLWEEVARWTPQPEELNTIRRELASLAQRNGLIRAFYWLFNINNTTINHYKLSIYDKICNPSSGDQEMKQSRETQEPTHTTAPSPEATPHHPQGARNSTPLPTNSDATSASKEKSTFGWLPSFPWGKKTPKTEDTTQTKPTEADTDSCGSKFFNFFKKITPTFSSKTAEPAQSQKTGAPPTDKKPSQQEAAVDDEFEKEMLITEHIKEPLQVLGISKKIGDLVSILEVKKRYFNLAIATHPDKNPSPKSVAQFQAVGTAYEALKTVFEERQNAMQLVNPTQTFREFMTETMARYNKASRKIDETIGEMKRETEAYCARADIHIQKTKDHIQKREEHLQGMGKKLTEQQQQIDELVLELQRVAQLHQVAEETPSSQSVTAPTEPPSPPVFRGSPVHGGGAAHTAEPTVTP